MSSNNPTPSQSNVSISESNPITSQTPSSSSSTEEPISMIASGSGTKRKAIDSISNSYQSLTEFLCPICTGIFEEAQVTRCGHTFCLKCIRESLIDNHRCPQCNSLNVEYFPNFLINELAMKFERIQKNKKEFSKQTPQRKMKNIQEMILSECDDFDLKEIDLMMKLLQKKKHQLEKELCLRRNQLMQDFLTNAKSKIHREQKLLAERLEIIEKDLNDLHEQMRAEKNRIIYEPMQKIEIEPEKFEKNTKKPDSSLSSLFNHNLTKSKTDLTKNLLGFDTFGTERQQQQGGKSYAQHNPFELNELFEMQRKKLNLYYDCFEKHYFDQCKREQFNDESLKNVHGKSGRFDRFKKDLNQFVLYSQLRPLASLNYAKDSSNIVSSIEFDKDMEFFAIAGVAKKIKIFDYAGVVKDSLGLSYPINDIDCSSKISCLCWNSYYKAMLATSDYEGNVIIWDAFIGQKLNVFQEHQKRCWSVDFNKIDINLVASGSDDTTVKLWSTNMNMSVITLNSSANICSVKFNPKQMHSLAFASADHCVYYYDLRNTKKPLILFNEHRKAVSYVEFLNENELVSASTDSQIKLWNTNQSTSILTYRGHVNEKNFVGLTSNNDFIACGSENNSLYIYYKSIDKQMLTYSFDKWVCI